MSNCIENWLKEETDLTWENVFNGNHLFKNEIMLHEVSQTLIKYTEYPYFL